MLIYIGASACIKDDQDNNISVRVSDIKQDNQDNEILILKLNPKNKDGNEIEIKLNKNTGDVTSNNYNTFTMRDIIERNAYVNIKSRSDEDNQSNAKVKVIDISNHGKYVEFEVVGTETRVYIGFDDLNKFSFMEATQPEEETEYLDIRTIPISPEKELIRDMVNRLSEVSKKNPKIIEKIVEECESTFALYDSIPAYPDYFYSNQKKINQFLSTDSPNIPNWILPIAVNKREVYIEKQNTFRMLRQRKNTIENVTKVDNKDIIIEEYGKLNGECDYNIRVNNFIRPFTGESYYKNEAFSEVNFPKYTLTEAIIEEGNIAKGKKNSRRYETIKKFNIIQMFLPSDKFLLQGDLTSTKNTMCILKDQRSYSRLFIPNTNIIEKIQESSNRTIISGTTQDKLKQESQSYTKTRELPNIYDNVKYVISDVKKNKSKLNLIVNATSLVSQINFSNIYWHSIRKDDNWKKIRFEIKSFQNLLKKEIKNSIKAYNEIPRSQAETILTESLQLFDSGIFDNSPEVCRNLRNTMITDYNLLKANICVAEALNKMINVDYGDAYYKYLNFCNSYIQHVGGDLNIREIYESQTLLMSGIAAINNMLGKERVISDFNKMNDQFIDNKINLSNVCLECEKSISNKEFCVNEIGKYDIGVIIRAIHLLNYVMQIYPEAEFSPEKCQYHMKKEFYEQTEGAYIQEAANNALLDTYVGSIIYKDYHYTALRLSEDKNSLEYFDSNNREYVQRQRYDLINFFNSLKGDGPNERTGSVVLTIVNVHYKSLSQMRDTMDNITIDNFTHKFGEIQEEEGEEGQEEEEDPERQDNRNNDNDKIILKSSDPIQENNDEEDDDQRDNKDLEMYTEMIMNKIKEYDSYTCHKYRIENERQMNQSFYVLNRLRGMEKNNLMKYQVENFKSVESMEIPAGMVEKLISRDLSINSQEEYYNDLLMDAFSQKDPSLCWRSIQRIIDSLLNNYSYSKETYSVKNVEGEEITQSQYWLVTYHRDEKENTSIKVKVMPEYFEKLSTFFNYRLGFLNLNSLLENYKEFISKKDDKYVCNQFNGLVLPISIGESYADSFYNSNILDAQNIDSIDSQQIKIDSNDKKKIELLQQIKKTVKFVDSKSGNQANNLQSLFQTCLNLAKDEINQNENDADADKRLFASVIIIGLQSSPFYCTKETDKWKMPKDNEIVKGVRVLSGYPAYDNVKNDNKNTLLYYISKFVFNKSTDDVADQINQIKDKISGILVENPGENELIRDNVKTFTMNIPDNNWYKKQWSFFLPPLFPVDIKIADINTQNIIQHLCNSNDKYNVKYTILNRIKNISLYLMNDNNSNNTNNTNFNLSNLLINLSKLIKLCYNIPSSANFIVSTKKNEEKIIEEIKIFDFSDAFMMRFLDFYCNKGPRKIVNYCNNEKVLTNIQNGNSSSNSSNKKLFNQVLKEVNRTTCMKLSFISKRSNKNKRKNIITTEDALKQVCPQDQTVISNVDDLESIMNENGNVLNFNKYVRDMGNEEVAHIDMLLPINNCGYEENVNEILVNLFKFCEDVNFEVIYNFLKVNIINFVNSMSTKEINKLHLPAETKIQMIQWHKCWLANLAYYGYSSNVIDDIIDDDKHDIIMAKLRYVFRFILCIASKSIERDNQYMKEYVIEVMINCLNIIKNNKECINIDRSVMNRELENQRREDRNKHANIGTNLGNNYLTKNLRKAGIHRQTNRQRAIDHGKDL